MENSIAFLLPVELKAYSEGRNENRVPPYRRLNASNLSRMRMTYRDLEWIVIDELSMISYEQLRSIHLRLCEIFNNTEYFGGKKVILCGDLLQLPPVNGKPIFIQPDCFMAEPHLWRKFHFIELQINQ